MWRHRTGTTLVETSAWCLTAHTHTITWTNVDYPHWGLVVITWEQFHYRYISHQLITFPCISLIYNFIQISQGPINELKWHPGQLWYTLYLPENPTNVNTVRFDIGYVLSWVMSTSRIYSQTRFTRGFFYKQRSAKFAKTWRHGCNYLSIHYPQLICVEKWDPEYLTVEINGIVHSKLGYLHEIRLDICLFEAHYHSKLLYSAKFDWWNL